jgi:hypothetical protein
MDYVLVFRPEVRGELDEAYHWYEKQKSGLGNEFLECVDNTLSRVTLMPQSYAIVYRDIRRVLIKKFPYVIYYRIISSSVAVTTLKAIARRLG